MRSSMKKKVIYAVLIVMLLILDARLLSVLPKKAVPSFPFYEEDMLEKIRNQQVDAGQVHTLLEYEEKSSLNFSQLLYAYFYSGQMKQSTLEKTYHALLEQNETAVETQVEYLQAVWSELCYFPIPRSSQDEKDVVFEDSWMQSRTYGGKRGHEGCDIMATQNQRGIYPVISVCDGTVEKMGWLPQGGYRLGIRSKSGAYFYYAHLSDYAENISIGKEVSAGELLAFMGDTGYSNVEGTTGNFAVHLHFGIYLTDENGLEFSVNPYAVLQYLKDSRLEYRY